MKKHVPVIVGILLSTMIFALAGCGNDGTDDPVNTEKSTEKVSSSETEKESVTEKNAETESTTGTESSEVPSESESNTDSGFTYTDMSQTMWTKSSLNVRALPNTEGEKLGLLSQGQEVKVTGQCKETGWYRIEYNGSIGYVSNDYVTTEKPAEQQPAPEEPGTPNSTVDTVKDVTGKTAKKSGSIYLIGNAGFESYKYGDAKGAKYAELITKVADSLKGVSNVYSMPIPLGSGVVMPDEYKSNVPVGDQKAAITSVLSHMGTNVKGVNIYDTLYQHRDEYLYFRTDHHWTQLGAYYAYTKFCAVKGIEAKPLDYYKHVAYTGFVGSFYFNESQDPVLKNAPDTVYTYNPRSNAKMTVTNTEGTTFAWPIIKDVSNYKMGVKYSCFIAGDNPYTVIKNSDITDGSSCIVVKESFGNAFVPLLVDHYQTIHVIDMRYWDGNLIEFAKENNVTDVIIANNLSAIGSTFQQGKLRGIIE